MEEIDVRHIHVLEFPKQLLWTDRDLEYFLEEMPSEERRMNNDIYDAFIKEVEVGKDYQPEEAFNLAYYECVRISLAKYPESKDIINVLEMDIQHNQSNVDYGYTDMIMNMVWAMLHATNTATRFADKLHSYLINNKKLKYYFKKFFTPNDYEHIIVYPYKEKEEPRYNVKFTPCPKDLDYKSSNGEWGKLTIGYKEHLIEELLLLWPKDRRDYVRKCIMDEKAGQLNIFADYVKSRPTYEDNNAYVEEIEKLCNVCDEWKSKYAELEKTAELDRHEIERLKQENTKQKHSIDQLQHQLDNRFNIVPLVKNYIGDRPFSPDVLFNRFVGNEEYEKKVADLEKEINELRKKQEQLRETEEYKAAIAEMKNELGKSHIRLDTIANCILRLPTFDLQYSAFQQITTLLTGTPWSEKAAEVLETMFKKLQEQQDRQEAKQDRVIDTLKKGVKEGVTIVNAQVYNKKVQQQDYHVATPRMDHQEPKELTDGR